MTTYDPHVWVLVEVDGDDPHYRIFGTWRGSYLEGESFRMNSGIESVTRKGATLHFHGTSGSEYIVHKDAYGMTGYSSAWLASLNEEWGGRIRILTEDEAGEVIRVFENVQH